ncbi:TPA: hypothetical protein ACX6QB_000884 [Photobacterium damselae]
MAISVRSIYLDKEIDAEQLKSIFDSELSDIFSDFREFVSNDVRCPYCGVGNGIYVKPKEKNGKVVANACFRFDHHNEYCVYEETNKTLSNFNIYYNEVNDDTSKLIRRFICAGIENNLFDQNDIRKYRKWFFDANLYKSELININKILLNISKVSVLKENTIDNYDYKHGDIDIDHETYRFLHFKFGFFLKERHLTRYKYLCDFIDKYNDREGLVFSDLKVMSNIENKAQKLHRYIFNIHDESCYYAVKRGGDKDITMSFICLLLYLSDWDFDYAKELFVKIDSFKKVGDLYLGNVIGVNPLKNYSKYRSLTILNDINKKIEFNLDEEFFKTKNKLIVEYEKIRENDKKKSILLEDDLPF